MVVGNGEVQGWNHGTNINAVGMVSKNKKVSLQEQ
jgi:hypothetical protein